MRPVLLCVAIFALVTFTQVAAVPYDGGISGARRLKSAQNCRKHLKSYSLAKFCRIWLHGAQPSSGATITSTVTFAAPTQTFITTNTVTTVETTVSAISPNAKRSQAFVPHQLSQFHFPPDVITDGCLLLLYGTLSYPPQTNLVTTTTTPSVTKTVQASSTATYPDRFVVRLGTQYAILGPSVYPVPSVSGDYQLQTLIDTGNTTETAHTGLVYQGTGQLPQTFGVWESTDYGVLQSVPEQAYAAVPSYKKINCTLSAATEKFSATGYRGPLSCAFGVWDTFANINANYYSILTTKDYCSSAASLMKFPGGGCTNWDSVQWEADDYKMQITTRNAR